MKEKRDEDAFNLVEEKNSGATEILDDKKIKETKNPESSPEQEPEESEKELELKPVAGINKDNLKSKSFKVAFQPKFKKTTSKTKKIAAEKIDADLDFNKMTLGDEVDEK